MPRYAVFILLVFSASGGAFYMRGSGDMKNIYQQSSELSSPQRFMGEVAENGTEGKTLGSHLDAEGHNDTTHRAGSNPAFSPL